MLSDAFAGFRCHSVLVDPLPSVARSFSAGGRRRNSFAQRYSNGSTETGRNGIVTNDCRLNRIPRKKSVVTNRHFPLESMCASTIAHGAPHCVSVSHNAEPPLEGE